jgi:hypothetical protein
VVLPNIELTLIKLPNNDLLNHLAQEVLSLKRCSQRVSMRRTQLTMVEKSTVNAKLTLVSEYKKESSLIKVICTLVALQVGYRIKIN